MPRVKIDYVVSFSNEDPENQASNLLSWDVSKKKWLCSKGETSTSVVLQLARAIKISSVQIGAHHAALVEVLVGRSETPGEPFQVLVPSSVFLTPQESRSGQAVDRVRSFDGAALAAASAQRWDRLRVVCSQPYNKHCKYGLSFIHIFEPDGESAPASMVPPRLLSLDYRSSDEEDFRPGELFEKHRQSAGDTGAQIRQATSQALKNNSDAATKLMKTSLTKNKHNSSNQSEPQGRQRDKDNLIYTKDDEQPHAKIDHIVQRHKDEKSKDEAKTPKPKEKVKDKVDRTRSSKREESTSRNSESKRDSNKVDSKRESDERKQADRNGASSSKRIDESRKRPHPDRNRAKDGAASSHQLGPKSDQPLVGVVFVLSGYENPRRARLRDLGMALGATFRRDWGPGCTHLICAFNNTPKLATVRGLGGGGGGVVPAPKGEWIEECGRVKRLLPWGWFAAEAKYRVKPPANYDEGVEEESECDTDDEIEKVLRQQKKARGSPSPSRHTKPSPKPSPIPSPSRGGEELNDSDEVEFVNDERMQGNVTIEDSDSDDPQGDTDVDIPSPSAHEISPDVALPALFEGRTFVLDERMVVPQDVDLLTRYCIAYGGFVLRPSEVDEDSDEHYILCGSWRETERFRGRGRYLRASWLWKCHEEAKLWPIDDYLIEQ